MWLTAVAVVYVVDAKFFIKVAHYGAAISMFILIVGVVIANSVNVKQKGFAGIAENRDGVNRYAVIALIMVATALGILGWKWGVGWDHAVLWAEGLLITEFAVFWYCQSRELWNEGLRPK